MGKLCNRIKNGIKIRMLEFLGLEKAEDKLRTLHYFNTVFHDATQLPPTSDQDLRILQKCDALILAIFDKVCCKYGLVYWLDYGTMLGAYRHGGFIPWDDDTDIVMPRDSYDRLMGDAAKELKAMDLDLEDMNGRYGLGYRHLETGIWVDIFCMEKCSVDAPLSEVKDIVLRKRKELEREAIRRRKYSYPKYCALRDSYFGEYSDEAAFKVLYHAISPGAENDIYLADTVYPIQKISFEGYQLNAPKDPVKYLSTNYGDSFMSLPSCGVEAHGVTRTPLRLWAKEHGVNMNEIHETLTASLYGINNLTDER